jgi:hypothetical protein
VKTVCSAPFQLGLGQATGCGVDVAQAGCGAGSILGQAFTLNNLGCALRGAGEHVDANAALIRAHDIFSKLNKRTGQAEALNNLGELARSWPQAGHEGLGQAGLLTNSPTALDDLRQAQQLYQNLRAPQAITIASIETSQHLTLEPGLARRRGACWARPGGLAAAGIGSGVVTAAVDVRLDRMGQSVIGAKAITTATALTETSTSSAANRSRARRRFTLRRSVSRRARTSCSARAVSEPSSSVSAAMSSSASTIGSRAGRFTSRPAAATISPPNATTSSTTTEASTYVGARVASATNPRVIVTRVPAVEMTAIPRCSREFFFARSSAS